jgi:hypothetical protein
MVLTGYLSQCYIRLPFTDPGNGQWRLEDLLGHALSDRRGTTGKPADCTRVCRPGRLPFSR